ncbi:MAG: hypothetical protein SFW35_06920 [Chitinophagales bacterium]|nr:hypothetical protein [Chitinophagales bacterium]
MKKGRLLLLCFLLLMASLPSMAQITTEPVEEGDTSEHSVKPAPKYREDKLWKWSNFYVGGVPGFGISSYYMEVSVAGEAGYFVHNRIALGLQSSYTYSYDRYYEVSYNIIRSAPYIRGYIWEGLFAEAAYEFTTLKNFKDRLNGGVLVPRFTSNSLLLGGGYHDSYENGFGFYFAVLASVLNTNSVLNANPAFQLGLTYRFSGNKHD